MWDEITYPILNVNGGYVIPFPTLPCIWLFIYAGICPMVNFRIAEFSYSVCQEPFLLTRINFNPIMDK